MRSGLLDEVFVLHPKQEGQAMAMLASQVPVPIMPLLEALPRPPPQVDGTAHIRVRQGRAAKRTESGPTTSPVRSRAALP